MALIIKKKIWNKNTETSTYVFKESFKQHPVPLSGQHGKNADLVVFLVDRYGTGSFLVYLFDGKIKQRTMFHDTIGFIEYQQAKIEINNRRFNNGINRY